MARIVNSADYEPTDETDQLWFYNAVDSAVTREVVDPLLEKLDDLTTKTYASARALQAPVLSMMQTGVLIDQQTRRELLDIYYAKRERLNAQLNQLIAGYLDVSIEAGYLTEASRDYFAEFNPRSGPQVAHLLYGILGMPPVKNHEGNPTVDRNALERLVRYPLAQPYCKILMALRDANKGIGELSKELDADGRFRTTFGIAATRTGRFSSYASVLGTGSNAQNQDPLFRHMFVSDRGKKFGYIDLEQAEARAVGARIWNTFGDAKYLDACESGDTHTNVAMMMWPHIKCKADAEQIFWRNFSYRFLCKRVGFGLNYIGQPPQLSAETNIDIGIIEEFQKLYFKTFPAIREWHHWVAQELVSKGYLVSLMGRKRWFLGKIDDDATLREAVAYDPQETVAKLLNMGLFRMWWNSHQATNDALAIPLDMLFQIHDAVLEQHPEDQEENILPQALSLITTPVTLRSGRTFTIPAEAKVGWNWGEYNADTNPDGLVKWTPGRPDLRRRTRQPSLSVLDQQLH